MNNTFDINRFGLLIRKQWLEYGKLYLISLGIVAGILISIYGLTYWQITNLHGNPDINDGLELNFRQPLFVFLGILFFTLVANHYFAPLSQKPKATLDLTLPVSSLEKFSSGILFCTVLPILSYLIIFYLIDIAYITKLKSLFPTAVAPDYDQISGISTSHQIPVNFFERVGGMPDQLFAAVAGATFLTSVFLLGSLFYKKFQYIKTTITTMVFLGFWIVSTSYLGKYIFEDKIAIDIGNRWNANRSVVGFGAFGILLALTVVIYIIAYIRFKEKEV
ncbi:hypothetical protein ACVWYG_003120 [Pedobacter sp. UYEF25]